MRIKFGNKEIYELKWLCVIFLLILIKPSYFGQIAVLSKFYLYGSFVVTVILIILLLAERKIDFTTVWIFLFFGVMMLATFLADGDVYAFCRTEFCSLGACLLFALWMEKSPITLLKSAQILQIYIYINFLTILMYPDGMYTDMYTANWFLGYKNPQIRTILPILALALMYSYWRYSRINLMTYLLIACSLATFLLIDSATGLVGIVIFLLLILIFNSKSRKIPRFINLVTGFIAVLVLDIGIIFFGIQSNFSYLIENILGRSLDFTSRLGIWSTSVVKIMSRPIFGYGYMTSDDFVDWYGFIQATHPHNYYLYILCYGGIILFIILVLGIIYANKNLVEHIDNTYSKIVMFTLLCFFVMGISEAITQTVLLYPMYIMAMKADKLAQLGYHRAPVRLFKGNVKFTIGRHVLRR